MPSLASATSTGSITGTVTDASTTDPIEEIQVCAIEAGSGEYAECADTNASGVYTISNLASGPYKVRFSPGYTCTPTCTQQNYLTQYYNGKSSSSEATPVTVTAPSTTSAINAQMHAGGQVTGTVTDASTTNPIEGIQVCVNETVGEEFGSCVETDASGEYTISGLASGTYKVEFYPAYESGLNYIRQYYNGKSSSSEATPVTVTVPSTTSGINAQMHAGGQISGTVTDASTTNPIQGIEVCADEGGGNEFEEHCTATDASGEYTIAGLPNGSYKVVFSSGYICNPGGCTPQNYIRQYYNGKSTWAEADLVTVTAPATTSNIDAQMHEGGKIAGTVTDAATTNPIQGIEACAYEAGSGEYVGCASTNASGQYTISALPSGSYKVQFSAYGGHYLRQYYNGKKTLAEADPVTVTAPATTSGINAQMHEGAKITGTVTDAATTNPIAGIQVCARETGNGNEFEGHCASTSAGGAYTIPGLASGTYAVEFYPGYESGLNYIRQFYNGKNTRAEADPVTVTAPSTTSGINAQMHAGGHISGTVTDASTTDPIEGIAVCATETGPEEHGGCAYTNASGNYTIASLASGPYRVEFSPSYESGLNYIRQYYNGQSSWEEADPVTVTAPSTTSNINAQMHEGARITGTVTDASTTDPIANVQVCVFVAAVEGEPESCAYTNSSGVYTISRLASGPYKVGFFANGSNYAHQYYNGKNTWGEADPVAVTAPSTTSGINAQMHEGGKVTGTVTDASSTDPIANVEVCAYEAASGEYSGCMETDASGEYTISGLASGTYKVEFFPGFICGGLGGCISQNYIRQFYNGKNTRAEADPVTVTAPSTTSGINAQMHAGGQISGTVTDASTTNPVKNAEACAYEAGEEEEPYRCASTNESGEYTISGLASGPYKVEFSTYSGNYLTQYYNAKSSWAAADLIPVTIGPPKPGIDAQLVHGVKPLNTVAPSLTGTAAVGNTLSCSNGTWEHSPTGYADSWLRDGTPVSGQTASTYVVQSGDQGHSISCKVTATNASGSASAVSNAVQVPAPAEGGGSAGGGGTAPATTPTTPTPSPTPKPLKCKKGFKKKTVKGKAKCVRVKHRHKKR